MFDSGIIASIQPQKGSALCNLKDIVRFAVDCAPHAVALRVQGERTIEDVRKSVKIPIIGLIKCCFRDCRLITPLAEQAVKCYRAGADYVAMELSDRTDVVEAVEAVGSGIPVIADIADIQYAEMAEMIGCVAVTTALAGYIKAHPDRFSKPALPLVRKCVERLHIPVIAEGRYWFEKSVVAAKKAGAHSICIGAAIHEPQNIVLKNKLLFEGKILRGNF